VSGCTTSGRYSRCWRLRGGDHADARCPAAGRPGSGDVEQDDRDGFSVAGVGGDAAPIPIAVEVSALIGNVVRPPWKVVRLNQPRVAVPVAGVDVRPIASNCIPNRVFPAESVLLCGLLGTAAAPSRPGPHAPPGAREPVRDRI